MPSSRVHISLLAADFGCLRKAVQRCEDADADGLHFDVMDGHFVSNLTMGPCVVRSLRPHTSLMFDVHLMVERPWDFFDAFIEAGAQSLSIHAECYGTLKEECRAAGCFPKEAQTVDVPRLMEDVRRIRTKGALCFVAVNPGTEPDWDRWTEWPDGFLIMTVNPGFSHQAFMPDVLPKIEALRARFKGPIMVDGGINDQTAAAARRAGADVLVSASYFFKATDPREAVASLKNRETSS